MVRTASSGFAGSAIGVPTSDLFVRPHVIVEVRGPEFGRWHHRLMIVTDNNTVFNRKPVRQHRAALSEARTPLNSPVAGMIRLHKRGVIAFAVFTISALY